MINYISKLPRPEYANVQPRTVSLMGCTGSIGRSALALMAEQPERFKVVALAGGDNIRLLAEQAAQWRPPYLGLRHAEARKELEGLLPAGYKPEILAGQEAYTTLAALPEVSTVLSAQVGAAGLRATAAAAASGKVIALANKESLVLAGPLLRDLCAASGAAILPVDSEHNAIFQCLLSVLYPYYISGRGQGRGAAPGSTTSVKKLVLTASGGPFRGKDAEYLKTVTRAQALDHPRWKMGPKITVDSATLMNKGLEVIEACRLYGLEQNLVEVLVHPQSVVHSLVEFSDSSVLAQLGPADMRVPLAHCLGWPYRINSGVNPLNLLQTGTLEFEAPDLDAFPALDLCRMALRQGRGATISLNAANEVAVELFLEEKLHFTGIAELVEKTLVWHSYDKEPETLEDVLELDLEARRYACSAAACRKTFSAYD